MLIVDWLGRHADTIFAVVVLMAVFAVLAAVRPRIIETPFAKDATRVVIKLYSIIGGQIFFMAAGSILIAISFVLLRHVL